MDRSRNGATEHVLCSAGDASALQHGPKQSTHIDGGARCPLAGIEEQLFGPEAVDRRPVGAHRGGRERRERHDPPRAGGFGVVSAEGRFAVSADDGAGDAHRGRRGDQDDVAAADSQDLADAGRGAKHDLHDHAELPVGSRSRNVDVAGFMVGDRGADGGYLESSQRVGQACDVVHGVAWEYFVADGKFEADSHHDAGLLGAVVGLLGELPDEVVVSGDADLALGEILECRQHEGPHVALVEVAGGLRDAALDVDFFQPVSTKPGNGLSGVRALPVG